MWNKCLTVAQPFNKFPEFFEQNLSWCVQNSPPDFRTLSQINPDHNLFFKSQFISFLLSFLRKPECTASSPHASVLYASSVSSSLNGPSS